MKVNHKSLPLYISEIPEMILEVNGLEDRKVVTPSMKGDASNPKSQKTTNDSPTRNKEQGEIELDISGLHRRSANYKEEDRFLSRSRRSAGDGVAEGHEGSGKKPEHQASSDSLFGFERTETSIVSVINDEGGSGDQANGFEPPTTEIPNLIGGGMRYRRSAENHIADEGSGGNEQTLSDPQDAPLFGIEKTELGVVSIIENGSGDQGIVDLNQALILLTQSMEHGRSRRSAGNEN